MAYKEDDFLQLSGLQHFAFCRRQWALIHIEQQWVENGRTTEGHLMHETAHDSERTESRGDLYIVRGLRVVSASMGVSGQCDVVEFRRDAIGIPLAQKEGLWQPFPVEYKRGAPKQDDCDALQLCAQAMCLEEMLCCKIYRGALYYGTPRRREQVEFTEELRGKVREMIAEMQEYNRRGHTPVVKPTKACNACSLKEVCLPILGKKKSVASYLAAGMEGE